MLRPPSLKAMLVAPCSPVQSLSDAGYILHENYEGKVTLSSGHIEMPRKK